MYKQYGFTLIEIMVSLFLANLLLLTLVQIYVFTKLEYQKAEHFLEQHLDRAWLVNHLSNSIRRSGFTPCLPLNNLKILDHRQPLKKIQSLEINSSTLVIKRMYEQFNVLKKTLTPDQLSISNDFKMNSQHPLIIADCHSAEILEAFSINKQVIHLKSPLKYRYQSPIFVGEFIEESWRIKKNAMGQNSLYFQSEELSAYVSHWKIDILKNNNYEFLKIKLNFVEQEFLNLNVRIRSI